MHKRRKVKIKEIRTRISTKTAPWRERPKDEGVFRRQKRIVPEKASRQTRLKRRTYFPILREPFFGIRWALSVRLDAARELPRGFFGKQGKLQGVRCRKPPPLRGRFKGVWGKIGIPPCLWLLSAPESNRPRKTGTVLRTAPRTAWNANSRRQSQPTPAGANPAVAALGCFRQRKQLPINPEGI